MSNKKIDLKSVDPQLVNAVRKEIKKKNKSKKRLSEKIAWFVIVSGFLFAMTCWFVVPLIWTYWQYYVVGKSVWPGF